MNQLFNDPESMMVALGCTLGATIVGLLCGFFIGRWVTLAHEPHKLRRDREKTLDALTTLLNSTDKLNEDVDFHNAALVEAEKDISEMRAQGEVEHLQSRLLDDITSMVQSNRKLENELVQSRYQLERQAEELDKRKKEARTDSLCQTGNRKAFDEAMQYMLSRAVTGTPFSLMLVDVDNFKRINDTFGHSAGDSVLMNIGDALKACVRPGDIVCRLGGDEFGVLLESTGDAEAQAVGQRIRATVETLDFMVDGEDLTTVVTMSMGLTAYRRNDSKKKLYDRADEALYESKALGRNRLTTRLLVDERKPEQIEDVRPQKTYEELKAELMKGETVH